MKIERILKISSDDFYNYLENRIINEFKNSGGENIKASGIKKGLRYTNKISPSVDGIVVEIIEYTRGITYQSKLITNNDQIVIKYNTEPSKDALKVTFTQEVSSLKNRSISNFLRIFSEMIYYGRMANTLYKIQSDILNKKNSDEMSA